MPTAAHELSQTDIPADLEADASTAARLPVPGDTCGVSRTFGLRRSACSR